MKARLRLLFVSGKACCVARVLFPAVPRFCCGFDQAARFGPEQRGTLNFILQLVFVPLPLQVDRLE
jgi:hypothetical protein